MKITDLRPLIYFALLTAWFSASAATADSPTPLQERADRFLALVNANFQALSRVNSEAQWLAVTDVTPAHDAAS